MAHVPFSPQDYSAMLQGFEGAITYGTAAGTFASYAKFPLSQFTIAGKTGTADTTISSITKGIDEPNAWFVGFGPEPNPQYVVAVVVDHGGYGAQAAAPAVMNIFNYLVTNPVGALQLPTAKTPPTTSPAAANPAAGTPPPPPAGTPPPPAGTPPPPTPAP
jgi:penicillin-binding protein 2